MGPIYEVDLLNKTLELTKAALGSSNQSTSNPIYFPDETAAFIETVYNKLKEINESIKD